MKTRSMQAAVDAGTAFSLRFSDERGCRVADYWPTAAESVEELIDCFRLGCTTMGFRIHPKAVSCRVERITKLSMGCTWVEWVREVELAELDPRFPLKATEEFATL